MEIGNLEKIIANLYDKICYTHKKLKKITKPWISTEKIQKKIKFNQKA